MVPVDIFAGQMTGNQGRLTAFVMLKLNLK